MNRTEFTGFFSIFLPDFLPDFLSDFCRIDVKNDPAGFLPDWRQK
jgi:hypothetical protein